MDIEVCRPMVARKPDGFLGRYGFGDQIMRMGAHLEEAAGHPRVAIQLDPVHVPASLCSRPCFSAVKPSTGSETGVRCRD